MKKNLYTCPSCNTELTRIKRSDTEKFIHKISFGKLHSRKYICYSCLKEYTFGDKDNIPKSGRNIQASESIFNAPSFAFLILIVIVAAMAFASGIFSLDSLNSSFSFFNK